MIRYGCQYYAGDEDCHKCSVCGYIFDCPAECEEYTDYFGNQPYKEDIEAKLRGEA